MSAFSYAPGLPLVPKVYTAKRFSDGSRTVYTCGMNLGVGRSGQVYWMDDWGRVEELVSAGVLVREIHNGEGTTGHDTYRLDDWFIE